ncbi:peptidoglycan DD-metalloendopeptidase family protein [bacterium]|nr:peptidoglycan DD-metalloendopeptidase family protein [bacterium]
MSKTVFFLFASIIFISGCSILSREPARDLARSTKPIFYRAQIGDTIYSISKRFNLTPQRIAKLNGLNSTQVVPPGKRLFLGFRTENVTLFKDQLVRGDKITNNEQALKKAQLNNSNALYWPVRTGKIGSTFGYRSKRFHDGIDIVAPSGTPIFAAHDGIVLYSDNGMSGYGNLIIIRANDGLTTVYAHNRRNYVDVGTFVRRGDKIAEIGQTGRASGPHLHFEVRIQAPSQRYVAVDPLPFLRQTGRSYVSNRH